MLHQIVNSYVELLMKRSKKNNDKHKVYIFNTFFYETLVKELKDRSYNYAKYRKRFEKKKVKCLF